MLKKMNPLLKASIFYIFGNGFGQGIVLLGTIVFTRLMTQEDYGLYSTYYSIVSILTTFVGVNLFTGLCNAYVDYKNEIHKVRMSVLILSTIVFLGVSGVVLLGRSIFGIDVPVFLLIMALLHAYSFFVVNYFNYSANMENRYQIKTLFMILPNLLQVVVPILFIVVLPWHSLNARVVGSVLGVAVCAVTVYGAMLRRPIVIYNAEYWKYALGISIPSMLSSVSYMIMQQSDNIMITAFYKPEETAVYALIYNVGYILYAVLQATSGVWQVWIYRALDGGNLENIKKLQKWYLVVFAQMAYGLLMISPELVKLLGPETYWEFRYIPPFILGSCLMVMYTFYTTVGLFYKKAGRVSLTVFTAALFNIIANYLLIPKFGGIAAAYTSAAAYLLLFCLVRNLVQKLNYGLFSTKYFVVFLGVVTVGCVIFQCIYEMTLLRYIVFIVLLILSLLYMLRNKTEILRLVKK